MLFNNQRALGFIVVAISVIFITSTATWGKKISQQVEKRSFAAIAQSTLEESRFNEIRWELRSMTRPLLMIQYPAIKVAKVKRHVDCGRGERRYEGYMLEVVLLSYWGIATPLHANYNCGSGAWGRLPLNNDKK